MNEISMAALLVFIMPLIIGPLSIYIFSIEPSERRNRRIQFRLMRQKIQTKEQNDAMWSSSGTSDEDVSSDSEE